MKFTDLFKRLIPSESAPNPVPMDFMAWTGNGCDTGFCIDFDSLGGISDAYDRCSTLKTVVNRSAMAMANGKVWIVDQKDNDVSNKYPDLWRLIGRPNLLQTWTEFIMQLDVMRQLYGEVFIYVSVPVGYSVQEAVSLWVINPKYIEIELSGRMYHQVDVEDVIRKYYLTAGGVKSEIATDRIIHIKDVNQNLMMSPLDLRGKSRLTGLENDIRNIIQAEEAIYSLNKDRGAQGILSNERKDAMGPIPLTKKEKEDIQRSYRTAYGLSIAQKKVIITDASLKWQQMSFNVRDLMLYEGIDKNIQLISDAFGYPYELLGVVTGVTYANKLEAKRFLYQDTVIPISAIYAENLTRYFGLGTDRIIFDFSGVECLKKSEAEEADTLYKKNQAMKIAFDAKVISRAEWRLAIGMDEDIYKPDNESSDNGKSEDSTEKAA